MDSYTKGNTRPSRKTLWILLGVGVLVILGVTIGVAVAVTKKKGDQSSGNSSSNPDPSMTFTTWDGKTVDLTIRPDKAYKKSFYGMNYGPVNATWPKCGNTLGDVIQDIKVVSQLTNRIRLYGMDCNMANYTLLAIGYLKLNISVIPTIWVDGNETTYQRQKDDLYANLKQHGFKNIEGISVGNEVIFRKELSVTELFDRVASVRTEVRALPGAPNNIPVFTTDLGSSVGDSFVSAVDVVFANVHPYFAGTNVGDAADWTLKWFDENDVEFAKKQNKDAVIAEVGWPTDGLPTQGAVASIPNLQTFLEGFVCKANQQQYKYYWFEFFDTPWKTERFTVLEGSWGLFYPDLRLKPGLNLPDCQPTAPDIRR